MSDMVAVYEEHLAEWLPQLIEAAGNTLRMTALAFVLAFVVGAAAGAGQALSDRAAALVRHGLHRSDARHPLAGHPLPDLLRAGRFRAHLRRLPGGGDRLRAEWRGLHGGDLSRRIASIHAGQMEAALTVGMTPLSAMRWVILPQALRVVLPPLANFGIALLKDTSVASIISAPELMLRARDLASSSFLPMEVFLLAAAIYLAMSLPIAFLTRRLEARFRAGQAHV